MSASPIVLEIKLSISTELSALVELLCVAASLRLSTIFELYKILKKGELSLCRTQQKFGELRQDEKLYDDCVEDS